jgi:hypothetical protein
LLRIASAKYSAAQLEERLRTGAKITDAERTTVLARVSEDRLVLDLRTVFRSQEEKLTRALAAALN